MNGNATDATAKDPNSAPMDVDGDNGGPDDDSDPVVHEIPVFIAKSLQNNLYLFQVHMQCVYGHTFFQKLL